MIASRSADFPVGSYVRGQFGWVTHKRVFPRKNLGIGHGFRPDPLDCFIPLNLNTFPFKFGTEEGDVPLSFAMGLFGITGYGWYANYGTA